MRGDLLDKIQVHRELVPFCSGLRAARCGRAAEPADQPAAGGAAGGRAVTSAAAAVHSRNNALPRISTGGQLGGAGGGCWLRGQVARTRAKIGGVFHELAPAKVPE
jgi:hypothetical protein